MPRSRGYGDHRGLREPTGYLLDARDIADELTWKQVKLRIGGSVHDPTDPVGELLFSALAMVAEFEVDLTRLRTREGLKVAKAKAEGRLRGKQPNHSASRGGTW
jgi:DNA invertase Pin-like site-specific DNA recombinase